MAISWWCKVLIIFLVMCVNFGLGLWTRTNPLIVEEGTQIEKNGTHILLYQPSGEVLRYAWTDFTGYHHRQHHYRPHPHPNPHPYTGDSDGEDNSHNHKKRSTSTADGWVSSFWSWGTSYSFFSAQWTVPNEPMNTKANIVFFFNSLVGASAGGSSGSDILQPVLQYNNGVTGWTLASWYGVADGAFTESQPVPVKPGDTITGVITLTNGYWFVLGYVNGVLKTNLTVAQEAFNGGVAQNTAQWALEVYDTPDCSYYPPNDFLSISNIVLMDNGVVVADPTWETPTINSNACNAAGYPQAAPVTLATVSKSDTLTLTWQSNISIIGSPRVIAGQDMSMTGKTTATVNAASAIACASACDSHSKCLGWVWNSNAKPTSSCILLSTITARTALAGRISGVKQGQVGRDRIGNDLAGYPITLPFGSTASTCAAYCNGNAACHAWSYNSCKNLCSLKSACGNATTSTSCFTAGVKGTEYTDHLGGDLFSHDLPLSADATQCASLCAGVLACSNWVFTYPGVGCGKLNTCWLKTGGIQSQQVDACRISNQFK